MSQKTGGLSTILRTIAAQRHLVNSYDEFLRQQNVTHFFTLTSARPMSRGRMRALFLEWTDALEWLQRRALGWFRADEMKRWSGLGQPAIPLHYHDLLVGAPDAGQFLTIDSNGSARLDLKENQRRPRPRNGRAPTTSEVLSSNSGDNGKDMDRRQGGEREASARDQVEADLGKTCRIEEPT